MARIPKCQLCKQHEAIWAMQDLPGNDHLSFYTLGSHIRGFRVTKVCDKCRDTMRAWQANTQQTDAQFCSPTGAGRHSRSGGVR